MDHSNVFAFAGLLVGSANEDAYFNCYLLLLVLPKSQIQCTKPSCKFAAESWGPTHNEAQCIRGRNVLIWTPQANRELKDSKYRLVQINVE